MSPEQVFFVILAGIGLVVLVWWLWVLDREVGALAWRVYDLTHRVDALEPVLKRATAQLETGRGQRDWRAPARVVS